MARRRSSNSTRSTTRKSERERRVEMVTWALLVLVFAVLQILPADSRLPNYFVPLSGAIILLGSGLYQYAQRWRVSPVTWIGGVVMALLAYYNMQIDPNYNSVGIALLVFFGVIGFGVITGET